MIEPTTSIVTNFHIWGWGAILLFAFCIAMWINATNSSRIDIFPVVVLVLTILLWPISLPLLLIWGSFKQVSRK